MGTPQVESISWGAKVHTASKMATWLVDPRVPSFFQIESNLLGLRGLVKKTYSYESHVQWHQLSGIPLQGMMNDSFEGGHVAENWKYW